MSSTRNMMIKLRNPTISRSCRISSRRLRIRMISLRRGTNFNRMRSLKFLLLMKRKKLMQRRMNLSKRRPYRKTSKVVKRTKTSQLLI